MISWSWFALIGQARGHDHFCDLYWFIWITYKLLFLSKSDLCLTQTFCIFGVCWDTVNMSVSLPPVKLADIQQLALSLLQTQHVTVCQVMSFLSRVNFCSDDHSQLGQLCCVIQ